MKMLRFPSAGWSANLLLGSVFYVLLSPAAFPQGPLTPPGAPTPTMKTLDQIDTHIDVKGEKRIDLQNAPASAVTTTDANYHFIITQPGSYYLSANLGVTKTNGIQINAEGVTLDLNGFQISRATGSGTGDGIHIALTSHRASIRNGSIKGFSFGVETQSGQARACGFRDLNVSSCTFFGIYAGPGAVLESCRAHNNSGSYGIYAESGSSVTNCTASNNTTATGIYVGGGSSLTNCTAASNTGFYGIYAESGSSLTNCSASANVGTPATSAGIRAGGECTISHCTASFNQSTAAPSSSTTGMGFSVGSGNTIRGCTANFNQGDGISITTDTFAQENTCRGNGAFGGDGGGIHVTGNNNRIEGSNVTSNTRGIQVSAAGNLIVKNSARNNGASSAGNYVIVADNRYGPIIDDTATGSIAASGKGPFASTVISTDPWANFSY